MPGISWVNMFQTNQERSEKYHLLRSIGVNVSRARDARDWRLSAIERIYAKELGLCPEVVLPPHKVKRILPALSLPSDLGNPAESNTRRRC